MRPTLFTSSRLIVGSQKGSGRVVLVVVGPAVVGASVVGAAVVGEAVVGAAVVGAAVVGAAVVGSAVVGAAVVGAAVVGAAVVGAAVVGAAVVGASVVGAAVVGAAVVGAAVVGAAVVGAAVVGDAVVGAAVVGAAVVGAAVVGAAVVGPAVVGAAVVGAAVVVVVPGSMVELKHCREMAPEPPSVATIVFTPHTLRETKLNSLLPVTKKSCLASEVPFSANASTPPFSSVSTKRKSSTQLESLNVMVIVPPPELSSTLGGVPPVTLVQPSPSQQLIPQPAPQLACSEHALAS